MQINSSAQTVFTDTLRTNGFRNTKAKQVVFDVLKLSSKPLTIQQIASSSERVHFVSIYRSVEALQKAGIVQLVPQGFKSLYELSELFQDHHHHATCESCGKTTSIHDDRVETLLDELSIQAGLLITNHHLEVFGLCIKCQKSKKV